MSHPEVTPDGTSVVANENLDDRIGGNVVLVALDGDHAIEPLFGFGSNPVVSPDGRWVAYYTNETGRAEVHVKPFPNTEAGGWQVSTAGGAFPVWSRNGEELFFLAGGQLMAASVETDGSFTNGTPEALLDLSSYALPPPGAYDVAPDERFLMLKPEGQTEDGSRRISVVLDWFEELKARVPTN